MLSIPGHQVSHLRCFRLFFFLSYFCHSVLLFFCICIIRKFPRIWVHCVRHRNVKSTLIRCIIRGVLSWCNSNLHDKSSVLVWLVSLIMKMSNISREIIIYFQIDLNIESKQIIKDIVNKSWTKEWRQRN